MTEILNQNNIDVFINKTKTINENTSSNWGKMNSAQMLQHLNKSLEILFTNKPIKRMFIGRIIGKLILKKALKNQQPIDKNSPTAPSFVADIKADFNKEQTLLLSYLEKLKKISEIDLNNKVHPFFGKMSGNEWNVLIYKHLDHHFKQFS